MSLFAPAYRKELKRFEEIMINARYKEEEDKSRDKFKVVHEDFDSFSNALEKIKQRLVKFSQQGESRPVKKIVKSLTSADSEARFKPFHEAIGSMMINLMLDNKDFQNIDDGKQAVFLKDHFIRRLPEDKYLNYRFFVSNALCMFAKSENLVRLFGPAYYDQALDGCNWAMKHEKSTVGHGYWVGQIGCSKEITLGSQGAVVGRSVEYLLDQCLIEMSQDDKAAKRKESLVHWATEVLDETVLRKEENCPLPKLDVSKAFDTSLQVIMQSVEKSSSDSMQKLLGAFDKTMTEMTPLQKSVVMALCEENPLDPMLQKISQKSVQT